jgi:hypothetical protein
MADVARARRHMKALEPALREKCRTAPAYAAAIEADATAGLGAAYDAAGTACEAAQTVLEEKKPPALKPRVLADLAKSGGTSDLRWLSRLAVVLGAKEAAPLLEARVGPVDSQVSVAVVDDIAALDRPRADRLYLAAFTTAPGKAYDVGNVDCGYPHADGDIGFMWSGEPHVLALVLAQRLRASDSPAMRKSLLALAAKADASEAVRQMSTVLLMIWGAPVPADVSKRLVLNLCQKQALDGEKHPG